MPFQLPTDLIEQVQISLRNDVGLPNYDPGDQTLPSLPPVAASIATIDPSTPSYLRCKNCRGKLLRGIQSMICIYCGKQQQNKDLPPDPISFNSTSAFRWLLNSLELDESETIEVLTEGSESNRGGQTTTKCEVSLSELLDLQITWSGEPERPEAIDANYTSERSSRSLNLNGADLDNVFSASNFDSGIPADEQESIDETFKEASVGQENLSFFSRLPSADSAAVVPSEDNNNDGNSFSGWAAEFQAADKREESKSLDPFISSTVDLSSQLDSVFGSGKTHNTVELQDESRPALSVSYDWMQDDLWATVNSTVSQQAEGIGSSVETKDSLPHNIENSSSTGLDWFGDSQWQTDITNAPTSNTIDEPEDSFGEWNDFTSSTTALDPSGLEWEKNAAVSNDQMSDINLLRSGNFQGDEFGSFSESNLFPESPGIQSDTALANNILYEIASDRIGKAQSSFEEARENSDVAIAIAQTTQPIDDVEMLMSQMHDLSFMLRGNLSVPSKLDVRSGSPRD